MNTPRDITLRSVRRRDRWRIHREGDAARAPLRFEESQDFDPRTERNLASLHPRAETFFRAALRDMRTVAAGAGLTIQLISGTRTWDEQHQLWLQGRGHDGPIVTNADAGQSNHNYGLAGDIGLFKGGHYLDDLVASRTVAASWADAQYWLMVPLGEQHILTAGARWERFQDIEHFELRPQWAAKMSEGEMIAELFRRHQEGIDVFA